MCFSLSSVPFLNMPKGCCIQRNSLSKLKYDFISSNSLFEWLLIIIVTITRSFAIKIKYCCHLVVWQFMKYSFSLSWVWQKDSYHSFVYVCIFHMKLQPAANLPCIVYHRQFWLITFFFFFFTFAWTEASLSSVYILS